MTSSEENKRLVRRMSPMWEGEMDVVDELFAPAFVNHAPMLPDAPQGPEGVKRSVEAMREAFPDIRFETEDVIAEDDKVVIRVRGRGTHEGTFLGVEPTGRDVEMTGIVIFRFEEGQVVERWATFDTLATLRQMGASPDAEPTR